MAVAAWPRARCLGGACSSGRALAVLTDPGRGVPARCARSSAYGFWICERLDHPEERVMELSSSDPLPEDLDPLHLVVLIAKAAG